MRATHLVEHVAVVAQGHPQVWLDLVHIDALVEIHHVFALRVHLRARQRAVQGGGVGTGVVDPP